MTQQKTTAVEWLENELNIKGKLTAVDFYQAKQMEKEQIIAANEDSSTNGFGEFLTGEQYYNKMYGNKNDDHTEQHLEMVSSSTEISDEEIEKQSKYWNETTNQDMWTFKLAWKAGAKWYREQLKQKL